MTRSAWPQPEDRSSGNDPTEERKKCTCDTRGAMERQQIAELRARLDTIERLLAQLSAELKGIRETLHAAAPAVSKDPEN